MESIKVDCYHFYTGGNDLTKEKTKAPNPVDVHVGGRLRLRRNMLDISQEKLADSLGITFQQIQKYEKGANRLSASKLFELANILNVPVSYFFEKAPSNKTPRTIEKPKGFEEGQSKFIMDFLSSNDGLHLNRAFVKIKDPKIRKKIVELVESLADR
jgi:transcriptional regulator with XRE-family HTH domain